MNYKQFINEKLGIVEELDEIADVLIEIFKSNIDKGITNFIIPNFKIAGQTIKLRCIYNKDLKGSVAGVETTSPVRNTFQTSNLEKSTFIHELKHIHRSAKRGWKKPNRDLLNNVNTYLSQDHKHLFTKQSEDLLYRIIYYTNPNEFESFFNQFHQEIKEEFEKNEYTDIQKRKYIKDFLDNQLIYMVYKIVEKHPDFSIRGAFKSKRSANEYIKKLTQITDSTHQMTKSDRKSMEYNMGGGGILPGMHLASELKKYSKLVSRIKMLFSKYIKDVQYDEKVINQIDRIIQQNVKQNVKKFHRLYTLLID